MKKPLICLYSEGMEVKVSVLTNERNKISVHQNFTILRKDEGSVDSTEDEGQYSEETMASEGISFDDLDAFDTGSSGEAEDNSSTVSEIVANLANVDLVNAQFIPVISDPQGSFHLHEGAIGKDKKKTINDIITEIKGSKGIFVPKDQLDFVSLNEKLHLSLYCESSIETADLVTSVANYNGKRYYKIPSIKSAEIALANFVSRTTKFFPEDYSLIIYTGREFSKLIFLEGQNLKHIGATLDIGTENLSTYDVYFSKILLEMENGGVPRLDNVVICGDDRSENLVLSFYGTFPEANVSELKFDMFDDGNLTEEEQLAVSSYSIPIAAAYEYYAELDKELTGINILPRYIIDNQKAFQFGWHSFAVLPFIFAATFYFTFAVLSNIQEIKSLDQKINEMEELARENQILIDQMDPLTARISNFDNAQAILDSATSGTEIWGHSLERVSSFMERRRNFWISHMDSKNDLNVTIRGFSLSRSVLTEFSEYSNSSILINILYEPLREKNAFAYVINFKTEKKKNR
jgi:hypothetical protein